jgi:pimeloyl-ACP methyl ester carboxylesterase
MRFSGHQGACLEYGDSGAGTPLVLLHGSPGDGRAWGRVTRKLPEKYRIVKPDLPGHGASDALPPETPARAAAMAAAVGELIDAFDAPLWLGGHSYGGNVALHSAARAPGRFAGLMLFEPVMFGALALTGSDVELASVRRFFGAYVERVAAGAPDAVSGMIDFWFGAGAYDRLPAATAQYLREAAPRNALDVRDSLADAMTREELGAVRCPVLLVHGSASAPVARAIVEALAKLLPDARIEVLAGATHGMLDSHAAAVAELIAGFCGR